MNDFQTYYIPLSFIIDCLNSLEVTEWGVMHPLWIQPRSQDLFPALGLDPI